MLTDADIAQYSKQLKAEWKRLDGEDETGAEDQGIVILDQQAVGRLSRMDAMQRQAMAQATGRRRNARRERIAAALSRIEDGDFGACLDCGEDIAKGRLELDPTIPTCVSCASD